MGDRTRGIGGNQESLSPFVTSNPVPETIVRRGQDGFVRAEGVQLSAGKLEVGDVELEFPLTAPPDATFLHHIAGGVLDWLPAGAFGGIVDWSQIVNQPATLAGYGILDAYTQSQVQGFFNGITFADTGFGAPIGGIAARAQLPTLVAYEDELNQFTVDQAVTGARLRIDEDDFGFPLGGTPGFANVQQFIAGRDIQLVLAHTALGAAGTTRLARIGEPGARVL